MNSTGIVLDRNVTYQPKEGVIIAVAAAWVIMIGSTTLAAVILCGWKGAKSISMDWKRMRAVFVCR
jgi:hypothetical protein